MKTKSEKGSTLVLMLIIISVFVITATSISMLFQSEVQDTRHTMVENKSTYYIESALEDALQNLMDNKDWDTGFYEKNFHEGYYSLAVTRYGDTYAVMDSSVISAPALRTKNKSVLKSNNSELEISIPEVFKYAAAANGLTKIINYCKVYGDVYSVGDINFSNYSYRVYGDIKSRGNINSVIPSRIDGDMDSQNYGFVPPVIEFPVIDTNLYKAEALAGGTHNGNYVINGWWGSEPLGPKYITGNLTIKEGRTVNLQGTVYVDGDFEMLQGAKLYGKEVIYIGGKITFKNNNWATVGIQNQEGPLILSLGNKVEIKSGAKIYHGVIYTPTADIKIEDWAVFYGSLVGKTVEIKDGAKVYWSSGGVPDLPGKDEGKIFVKKFEFK